MRLFIGIPFTESVRSQIRKGVSAIRPSISKGKFSAWEGYHITLKFLGEVSEPAMAELALLMDRTPLRTEPFELEFTELGAFRKRGGDVLWVGLTQPPQLLMLQQEVETLCRTAGFEPDSRSYTPHLTLGRGVRYAESFEETAAQWAPGRLRQWVERIALFQSVQREGRLMYIPLVTMALGEAPASAEEDQKEAYDE